jgi:hypothetical protein
LIFKNGTPGHTPYDAIKLFLAGQPLATNKDFRGGQLTMKMDGTLSSGNNPLIIEAYGPIGSELTWKLVANKPVITAVKPETTGPSDSLTINGRNFSSKAGNVIVTVGGKQSTVVSSSSKSISIKTPTDLANGENNLVVSVAGIESKPFKVTSKSAAPELSSCSMVSAPPGQQITVSGKGFSNVSSENEVTIGGMVAPISSGSSTSLTVTIPGGLTWPQWNVPIIVKTKNVESKGSVTINLNQRVIPNDGVPEQ